MSPVLVQFFLAVSAQPRPRQESGWLQLLAFIAVGVIYALASIAKAKGDKLGPAPKRPAAGQKPKPRYKPIDDWGRKPVQKKPTAPVQPGPSRTQRTLTPQPVQRRVRPEPAAQPSVRQQQGITAKKVAIAAQEVVGSLMPDVAMGRVAKIEKLRTRLIPKLGEEKAAPAPAEEPATSSIFGFEIEDPLRAGILYYEILGKPVSLRDRFAEHYW